MEFKVACNFIKKRLQHRCFLVNTEKFLGTDFLNTLLWRSLVAASADCH